MLAEDADELAGIALCDPHPSGVGHIGALCVRAPWRGRGLGLALLEHAFAEFAARGYPAVILGAEDASPTGADRLYERAGMRVTHRRARYKKLLLELSIHDEKLEVRGRTARCEKPESRRRTRYAQQKPWR